MGDVVWLKALLKAIVLPPTGPLLLAAAGLLIIGRAPRGGRIVAWTGILLLIALSTPMVAFALLRYGAQVARLTGLPVLVTGGSVFGGEPEAILMGSALEREFGVPVRWLELQSRNTHENAVRSAEVLGAAKISRIVLVAHSFDMPRARAEFTAQGIETIPAPTGIPSGRIDTALDVLPGMAALQGSYFALYEIFANIVRWIVVTL